MNVKIRWIAVLICSMSVYTAYAQRASSQPTIDLPIDDGLVLYYASNQTGSYQLYKKEKSKETQLSKDENYHFWGIQISPDRRKYLCYKSPANKYSKEYNPKTAELWFYDIDGNNGKKLIDPKSYKWYSQKSASWSPDGSKILMTAEIKDPNNKNRIRNHLFVTNSLGQNPIQLSTRSTVYEYPVWSPSGNTIAYSSEPEATPFDLCTAKYMELYTAVFDENDRSLKYERKVTSNSIWDSMPVFTLDGQSLVYCIAVGCVSAMEYVDIQRVSLENGDIQSIRADKSVKMHPVVINNNIYVQYRAGLSGPWGIAKISQDGSSLRVIAMGNNYSYIYPTLISIQDLED